MAGSGFIVVVLFAIPSALAISCYTCTPRGQMEPCTSPKNVTNCDDVAPQGITYDACVNVSFQYAVGETIGQKQCGVKADCGKLEEEICNTTKIELETGMPLYGCLLSCCQGDQCNGGIVRQDPVDVASEAVAQGNSTSASGNQSSSGIPSLVQVLNIMCTHPDADCVDGAPQDACVLASFEMSMGKTRMTRSAMKCGIKPKCDKMKPIFCNSLQTAKGPGETLVKCDLDCCQEDECDWGKCSTPSSGLSSIASASTFVIAVCILMVFSGRLFQ